MHGLSRSPGEWRGNQKALPVGAHVEIELHTEILVKRGTGIACVEESHWSARLKRRAGRDGSRHQLAVHGAEKQLSSVAPPSRLTAAAGGNLPLPHHGSRASGKGTHVNFKSPGFVGCIGNP